MQICRIIFIRYTQCQKIGKLNKLIVFGTGKPKNQDMIVKSSTRQLYGSDHLTCRGVMVFCFVQIFFSGQHES